MNEQELENDAVLVSAIADYRQLTAEPTVDQEALGRRVLTAARTNTRRSRSLWFWLTPGLTLVFGSAALAASGYPVRAVLAQVFAPSAERAESGTPPVVPLPRSLLPAPSQSLAVAELSRPQAASQGNVQAVPLGVPPVNGTPANGNDKPAKNTSRVNGARQSLAPSTTPPSMQPTAARVEPPTKSISADLALYKQALQLHASGRNEAALQAWNEYVRQYPHGALVVEARYNRAVSLLRLGRTNEAVPVLTRYANGEYGAYREQAARLLQAH